MHRQARFMRFLVFVLASPAAWAECTALVGAWQYVHETNERADGTTVRVEEPAGGYAGSLVYTAEGRVAVVLMPVAKAWSPSGPTARELRDRVLAPATTAYTGRYTIHRDTGSVTHHIETSLDPAQQGRDVLRGCQTSDGHLELSGEWEYRGEKLKFRVLWKRIVPPGAGQPRPR